MRREVLHGGRVLLGEGGRPGDNRRPRDVAEASGHRGVRERDGAGVDGSEGVGFGGEGVGSGFSGLRVEA